MIRLFCGYDAREIPGFHVFAHSVMKRASRAVAIVPLARYAVPEGSNAFTLSRFLVPMLCGYEGRAIFCDAADMLMVGDVAKLDDLFDPSFAVQVVKHPTYASAHPRKYVGTEMECEQTDYDRKNWASVMLINCGHPAWKDVDESLLKLRPKLDFLQFRIIPEAAIGTLPAEWNVLIDEGQSDAGAQLLHWTAGIPYFWHYQNARRSQDWFIHARELSGVR
jgi:hypothetical protein